VADALRVLVMTVVHTPLDARIHERQIRAMCESGWHVTYAAPFAHTGTDPGAVHAGVEVVDLPRAVGRRRLRALRAARRALRDQAPSHDIVVLHDPDLLLALVGCRKGATPTVWDVHEDTAAALVDRSWVPRSLRPVGRWGVRAAELLAERYLHLLLAEDRYTERFRRAHPVIRNVPWWHELCREDVEPRVVMVGRLSESRGVDDAIEAGRRLATHGIEVELMGSADVDVAARVAEADARGWVHHLGFVPNAEALAHTESALAGLSLHHPDPNYQVSLPGKVLEYLMRGVPPIATPLPLVVDLVRAHRCAVLVDAGSPDQIVDAVLRIRDDPSWRRELVANGREMLRSKSWEIEAGHMLEALSSWAGRQHALS
jgi:glycosyltransferase involved in cell wall biosynthesis